MKKIILSALALVALAIPVAASASVTVNSNGTGFVGKGNVQTAFGWNNAALQANASGTTFSFSQPISQSVSQAATQDAKMAVTQSVDRTLSCTVTTGGIKNPKVFHNYGTRSGERVGERSGTREGSRSGIKTGSIKSALNGDPRQVKGQQQFTGFNLHGFIGDPLTTLGDAVYGVAVYGDAQFGDAVMGDVEWSGWVAEQGEHPSDCDREDNENDGKDVTDISDVTVDGPQVEGAIAYGDEHFGAVTEDAITTIGPAIVSATFGGVTKALA
jgi:hypothetical protein